MEDADLFDFVLAPVDMKTDLVPGAHAAVEHPEVDDGAAVGVVEGIEEQRPQRRLRIAAGRGQLRDDRLEELIDPDALLGRDQEGLVRVEPQVELDLLHHPLDVGGGEVDLVDDRQDLQSVLDGEVHVGQGLGLDPLAGVDQQQGALAGDQRPRTS